MQSPETRSRPWTGVIPPEEEALYGVAGFGNPSGAGKRPALLVIDIQYRSIGERSMPIAEAVREYPTSCGEFGWRVVPHVARLIAAFRAKGFPVIYPHVAQKGVHDGGRFADKAPAVMTIPPRGYEFVDAIAPLPDDIRIAKYHASPFFGTPLASHLVNMGVDSVFVTGCTTSGCVRAAAVDASSAGFRVIVPQDCVFDRSQVSHAVNLFDIASKYGDVLTMRETFALLESMEPASPAPA
jgi:maleamate amidohydrolase